MKTDTVVYGGFIKLAIWSNYYELSPEEAVKEFIKNGIYASELADEHGAMLLERGDDVKATGRAFGEFLAENGFDMTQGHLFGCMPEYAQSKVRSKSFISGSIFTRRWA